MSDFRMGLIDCKSKSKPPLIQIIDGQMRVWTTYNSSLTEGSFFMFDPDTKILWRVDFDGVAYKWQRVTTL